MNLAPAMKLLNFFRGDSVNLPPEVRKAAASFKKKRFAYFLNLASQVETSGGKLTWLTIFEKEAVRYRGSPRGILAEYWIRRMHETGARLAETWVGSVPQDELAVIAVAEARGRGAIASSLQDLARVGTTVATARSSFIKTIFMALVGVGIASAMLLAMPLFFRPFFESSFGFLPYEFYGPLTRRYYATADFIATAAWFVGPAIAGIVAWISWSMPNWVGDRRNWCDQNIVIYKLYRDFKGALFLASFASLTRSTGAEVISQRSALLMLVKNVEPWLKWKIQLMLERMDNRGVVDASAFDVNIVDREIYYVICDVFEARGLSEGLLIAGAESEKRAVESINSRGAVIRIVMLGGAVLIVICLLLWVYGCVFEFKSAIGLWANQ